VNVAGALLRLGAPVKATNRYGWAPIHVAVRYRCPQAIEVLLKHKADLERKNKAGWTPLMMASAGGYQEGARMLREAGAKPLPKGFSSPWDLLASATAGGRPYRGYPPYPGRPTRGAKKNLAALLRAGANVDRTDYDGNSALMYAANLGAARSVKTLLAAGASTESQNQYGDTPLMYAAREGHADVVKLLLARRGARVNHANEDGETALMLAAQGGHLDVVKLLLSKGATARARTAGGQSALAFACLHDHVAVARLLIEKGAEVNEKNTAGKPLLQAVEERELPRMAKFLRSRGAKRSHRAVATSGPSLSRHGSAPCGHEALVAGGPWTGLARRGPAGAVVWCRQGTLAVVPPEARCTSPSSSSPSAACRCSACSWPPPA
jgi:ankyrin repeat protein